MVKIGRNCNEHSMNIFHFFAIDLCGWARPDGGAATGQNRPKYGGFPLPAARAGQDGAGGLPPARRPGPMEKVCRYGRVLAAAGRARGGGRAKSVSVRGRTARAGFPRAQARTDGKSMPVRQGFGRRGAGARGRGAQNQSARAGRGADMERRQHHCAGGGIAAGRGVGERAGGAKSVSARSAADGRRGNRGRRTAGRGVVGQRRARL